MNPNDELLKEIKEVAVPFLTFLIVIALAVVSVIYIIIYISEQGVKNDKRICVDTYGQDFGHIQSATRIEPRKCLNTKTQETKAFPF